MSDAERMLLWRALGDWRVRLLQLGWMQRSGDTDTNHRLCIARHVKAINEYLHG